MPSPRRAASEAAQISPSIAIFNRERFRAAPLRALSPIGLLTAIPQTHPLADMGTGRPQGRSAFTAQSGGTPGDSVAGIAVRTKSEMFRTGVRDNRKFRGIVPHAFRRRGASALCCDFFKFVQQLFIDHVILYATKVKETVYEDTNHTRPCCRCRSICSVDRDRRRP